MINIKPLKSLDLVWNSAPCKDSCVYLTKYFPVPYKDVLTRYPSCVCMYILPFPITHQNHEGF